ncbi:1-deoxy-D-xylulose-5-phosphate synthase [Streptomyces sp. NPDC044571]|uniref:1-deoxy-D-xylulose-5-phosphate synthase n=1 Tax=Streptomyces sp. NPDC044571 TaxID=3155371 RepID=UPI0033D99B5E
MRLADLTGPDDLGPLTDTELDALAADIRTFLVESVAKVGGHLGPNLGVVELTMALHRVFESPKDVLLFDTGHQAYVHKLLTGRMKGFATLRQAGGLSGYPDRGESEHDVIENSHASTALSYADGIAKGFALAGSAHRRVVAVVGDGSLTGGMTWEALNNIGGAPGRPVIIVLNDNGRSYAPTTGSLADHLRALREGGPGDGTPGEPANLFETLGIGYIGPVDGHDRPAVEAALREAAAAGRPVVVHCVTTKGHGYAPAAEDPHDCWHAIGTFDPATGGPTPTAGRSWTAVFGEELAEVGAARPDVVAITAAMLQPVGLEPFARRFPDRTFDVGISEQHAVVSAAGLAHTGLHPVVAVYSTFLNRAFDQVLMDVALHRLPVTFVLDRAGVTGPDGASHHGIWDASWLSLVPGLRMAAPRDAEELKSVLWEAVAHEDGPTVVRFPKAQAGAGIPALRRDAAVDVLYEAPAARVLLVPVGPVAADCLLAAEELAGLGIAATVADPRWSVPVPDGLAELAARHELVVTVEDNLAGGGLGARLTQQLAERGTATAVRSAALPTAFLPHGDRAAILRRQGIAPDALVQRITAWLRPQAATR